MTRALEKQKNKELTFRMRFFAHRLHRWTQIFFSDRFFRIAQIAGASMAPAMRDVLLISHRRLRRQ